MLDFFFFLLRLSFYLVFCVFFFALSFYYWLPSVFASLLSLPLLSL